MTQEAPLDPPMPSDEPVSAQTAHAQAASSQAHNPLHGVTLQAMVHALVEHYGWQELGRQIPVRCFNVDPSMGSSLRFLRKTPWAREKVQGLYLFMQRQVRRAGRKP